ncbi:hypothetical protein GCM10009716_43980 [Streptomyces sodiiphilus]|uniref:Uncharacterized protein n=1 Tax=Streptomyces sodiiphilus TaxID=226217 RepID=A0ABP5B5C3_9ACTN
MVRRRAAEGAGTLLVRDLNEDRRATPQDAAADTRSGEGARARAAPGEAGGKQGFSARIGAGACPRAYPAESGYSTTAAKNPDSLQ